MSKRHLFSASLFDTLFQHNLVSSDGYVKANDDQIFAFRKFLVQQARDKTTNLYKVRKEMVDEVCNLLKEDEITPRETKKLVLLLHQLNLKITPEGILESEEPDERKPRYLGTSEPNKSTWERQRVEEERRLQVLQRDLKELDDWLGEIGKPGTKVRKFGVKLPEDSQKDEFRYRARTARRKVDMERARRRLILTYHAENAKSIRRTLSHKEYPGRVRFLKNVASQTERKRESEESFVTAASEFSFLLRTPRSVTQKEMYLARNIFDLRDEDESILRVRKSKAVEKIEVQPGVQLGIDEHIKFRPTKDITTFVSEPIVVTAEDDFKVALKSKRYKSDPTLDGKSSAIGTTIDEAKQYIIIYRDEGKETDFKLEDDERGSDEKIKSDKHKKSIETDNVTGSRSKSILKVSRKSIKMPSSSGVKKTGSITSQDTNRTSKEPPAGRNKDENNSKIDNEQKIIDSTDINKEKRNILITSDHEDGTKHQTDSQVEGKLLDRSITSKDEKQPLKEHPTEHKNHRNSPIFERQSTEDIKEGKTTSSSLKRKNVPEITQEEKEVKPAGQDKDENSAKVDNKQKIIDSKDNNNEIGSILKKMDAEDENKVQAERRPNLTQGKVDNKNHDELRDKNVKDSPDIESEEDDGLSLGQELSVEKDFKNVQLSEPEKDDFADDKNKTTTDNKEKNIDSNENSKKKEDSSKSVNEHNIEEQSKLKDVAKNKNDDKLRDKRINGHPEVKSNEKVNDSEENSTKKEDSSTSDNEGNIEEQPKLKENVSKSKKDDGQSDKIIKRHPETKSKADQVLTEDQHLSLEKDFQLAQRYELEKSDPKSRSEERVVSNAGSVEKIKDFEEEDKQKDDNSKSEKDVKDSAESNPEDSEVFTLDQQLSFESEINTRKSKEMRKRNSKDNSSENDGNINIKNDVGMSDSSENAKHNQVESYSEKSPKDIEVNRDLTLGEQLSLESEISSRKRKESDSQQEDHDNKDK